MDTISKWTAAVPHEVKIVDLSEQLAALAEFITSNDWDGRAAPVPEIWQCAFKDLFGVKDKFAYDFFYVNRNLIAAARFMIRSHLEKTTGTRNLLGGKIHGSLAVVWYEHSKG